MAKIKLYLALTRLNRPIGIYLLLWPTLSALVIASGGAPNLYNLIIFTLGVIIMRSAGCVINDLADRNFDRLVERTKNRPLASEAISINEALILLIILLIFAVILVFLTNLNTIYLACGALAIAALYPFMKRYTYYPQIVLGIAFSWGIPMAFTAQNQALSLGVWLLVLANILWTIAYDTYYALADIVDDLKIGVKSTAIAFGKYARLICLSLQLASLICLSLAGIYFNLGLIFYIALLVSLVIFIYGYVITYNYEPQICFNTFLNNHFAGLIIFIAIALNYCGIKYL